MLIALEGVDGCGKSTQVQLLTDRLTEEGFATYSASFPRYADPVFGDLIKRFLKGELGDVDSVDPRLVALLFAGDRAAEAPSLRQALCEDRIVVCDRYFYSNLAYQAAKLGDESDVVEFAQWLRKLEFGHYALPVPGCSIYLDVHQDERMERLVARAQPGAKGNGAVVNDIHERDIGLQARVEDVFRTYSETHDDLVRIDCQQFGELLNPSDVHSRIWRVLTSRGLLASASDRAPLAT
ncbi:MAG: dTMP kinase [Solirubrobacteraceae bacterium]|jgi:dTMP kinase